MAVVAVFSADLTVGTLPFVVQFTDASTGAPDTWLWEFGTGEGTSALQSPSHTYSVAGTFTVKLTATLGGDSDEEEKIAYITVKSSTIARPTKLYSGVKEAYPKDGWENNKHFYIEQTSPQPCVIQYTDLFVDTNNE